MVKNFRVFFFLRNKKTWEFNGKKEVTHSRSRSRSHLSLHAIQQPHEMQRLKFKSMLSPTLQWSFSSPLPPLNFKPCSSLQYSPWSGLQAWRESPLNENRIWGPKGPHSLVLQSPSSAVDNCDSSIGSASSLAELGALVLSTSDPLTKSKLSHLAYSRWRRENLPLGLVSDPPSRPARPLKPELVRFSGS